MFNYIYIPLTYLETIGISKKSFMQDSDNSQFLIKNILKELSPFTEIANIFLIKDYFVLVTQNKSIIKFQDKNAFSCFENFIYETKYKEYIEFDKQKGEISIANDIPPIFYNILYEFLV